MIYIMKTDKVNGLFSQDRIKKLLSAQRLEKMTSFYHPNDGIISAMAYILLRAALYKEYAIKDKVNFVFSDHNKPYLDGYEGVFFNISHCSGAVMCAVSDNETGVDIQDYHDVIGDCADMIFHCSEKEKIKNTDFPEKEMIRFWTMKEAYGKYIGKGILYELDKVSFSDVSSGIWQDIGGMQIYSECQSEYAYSVCSVHQLSFCDVSWQDISCICERLSF